MLFSVIIPIYNVEPYLDRCVQSVLDQTFADFEAILVDDGSKDNCPRICDAYAEKDPRIKVIHKPNGGLVSARNAGLRAAKGDYICYVDGDDWAKPNMLQFIHDKLKESPVPLDIVVFAADNVYTDHISHTVNAVEEGYYSQERMRREIYPYLLVDRRKAFKAGEVIHAHTWDKAIKRELHLAHYCEDERIRMFTDVAFVYECLLYAKQVYICNESLYMYNKTNETSITAGKRNYLRENFYILVSYLQKRLRGYSPDVDRQLNDYPVTLIIRAAFVELQAQKSFGAAVKKVKTGLQSCKLLDLVKLDGLPRNPKLLILLFKMGLYGPAMYLCKIKMKDFGK